MAGDINFKWPLRNHSKGFPDSHRSFQAAIKEDLKILLLTKRGERVMHPDMGTNIISNNGALFENMADLNELKGKMLVEAQSTVEKFLPAVNITNLTLEDKSTNNNLSDNEVLITIFYKNIGINGFSDRISFRISE